MRRSDLGTVELLVPELGRLEAQVTDVSDGLLRLRLLRQPRTDLFLLAYDASLVLSTDAGQRSLVGVLERGAKGAETVWFRFDAKRQMRQRPTASGSALPTGTPATSATTSS